MTEQSRLIDIPARPNLTGRQQLAFDYVRTHDGVSADEVGAHLHAHNGKHGPDERCEWCCQEGLSVLKCVALRPLVTYRLAPLQGRLYVVRDKTQRLREPEGERVSHVITDDPFSGL